jgi:hypothetical protein
MPISSFIVTDKGIYACADTGWGHTVLAQLHTDGWRAVGRDWQWGNRRCKSIQECIDLGGVIAPPSRGKIVPLLPLTGDLVIPQWVRNEEKFLSWEEFQDVIKGNTPSEYSGVWKFLKVCENQYEATLWVGNEAFVIYHKYEDEWSFSENRPSVGFSVEKLQNICNSL